MTTFKFYNENTHLRTWAALSKIIRSKSPYMDRTGLRQSRRVSGMMTYSQEVKNYGQVFIYMQKGIKTAEADIRKIIKSVYAMQGMERKFRLYLAAFGDSDIMAHPRPYNIYNYKRSILSVVETLVEQDNDHSPYLLNTLDINSCLKRSMRTKINKNDLVLIVVEEFDAVHFSESVMETLSAHRNSYILSVNNEIMGFWLYKTKYFKKEESKGMGSYKRYLDKNFITQLQGEYSFLQNCSYRKEGNYKFDVQFRPDNTIMIYDGGTCLLTVKFDTKTQQITFSSKSYAKKHQSEFQALVTSTGKDMKTKCLEFLDAAAEKVTDKWKNEGTEGYWEQRISRLWGGPSWHEYMDMLVIDRQAIITFDNKSQKTAFYEPIKTKYLDIIKKLCNEHTWMTKKTFGDELDLLAIGPDKELVCIELKTAKTDKNFYYAPLQAAAYCEAFINANNANNKFSDDIKEIVRQKVAVGLLPNEALNRLPQENFKKTTSQVLIMDSSKLSLDSKVWKRLSTVVQEIDMDCRPLIRAIP